MVDPTTIDQSLGGKRVVNTDGEQIGLISGVRDETAYVDPEPGIGDTILTKLGWDKIDEGDYPLRPESIDRVTDDAVYLTE